MFVAGAWAFISIAAARLSVLWSRPGALGMRIFLTWVLMIPLTIILPPGAFPIAGSALLLMVLMPRDPVEKVAYFIGIFPAMADFYYYEIPFPGMRYLIEMSFYKVAVLVVLLPIAISNIMAKRRDNPVNWVFIDSLVVIFAIYVGVMTLRDASFTAMLRIVVDQFITIVVPYLAISRTINSREAVDQALWGFFFMAVITAWITIFSGLLQWEFYRTYTYEGASFRYGMLRVAATMNTNSVCVAAASGFLIAQYFRNKSLLPIMQVWLVQASLIAAVILTGNRAGLLQLGILVAAFYGMRMFGTGFRKVLMVVGIAATVIIWPMVEGSEIDETFAYRADLINASIPQFLDYPFFGQVNFSDSHYFDDLDQPTFASEIGGRHIDVVNWYLQVLLEYGLVGIFLFVVPPLVTVSWLYRNSSSPMASSEDRLLYRTVFALSTAYLVIIATTSAISLMPVFFVLFLGMARALHAMGSAQYAKAAAGRRRRPRPGVQQESAEQGATDS